MRPAVQIIALSRLLVLAWLMTCVAIAPLFDTYLPDLPDTTDGPTSLQTACQKHFFRLSNQVSNFQDVTAAILEDDDDSKKRKGAQPSAIGVHCPLPNRPLLPNSVMESRARHPRLLLFSTSQGPRAPPSIVSL